MPVHSGPIALLVDCWLQDVASSFFFFFFLAFFNSALQFLRAVTNA